MADELAKNTLVIPSGIHEENHNLYLTVVDGRVHDAKEIENLSLAVADGKLISLKEIATVSRPGAGDAQVVTANGSTDAVLLNIFSQPDASTVDIADRLQKMLPEIRLQLPPGMQLSFFL